MSLNFESAVSASCCFGIFKEGPFKIHLHAQKKGFVPGETMYIRGQIENTTSTPIDRCDMQLVQVRKD